MIGVLWIVMACHTWSLAWVRAENPMESVNNLMALIDNGGVFGRRHFDGFSSPVA